jgi:hypothetical protein
MGQHDTVHCESASADGDHTYTGALPAVVGVVGRLQACG